MSTSPELNTFPKEEYDIIEQEGRLALLREGIPAQKLNLRDFAARRLSLDLIFVLPEDLRKAVHSNLLTPIRDFFEGRLGTEQIFYNRDNIHCTLFQILTAESEPNYTPEMDPIDEYIHIARSVLLGSPGIEISYERFLRFPGSPGGLMLGGIPTDNRINQLRDELKSSIEIAGLRQYRPRDVKIAHISLMRDLTPVGVKRADEIIDFVRQKDHTVWWAGVLNSVNLQTGNYFMDPDTVTTIQPFILQDAP